MSQWYEIFDGQGVPARYFALSLVSGSLSLLTLSQSRPISLTFGYAAANFLVVTGLILRNDLKTTGYIGKNPINGQIPLWSMLIWWPFHFVNRIFAKFVTHRKVELATEVSRNLYVGCWHSHEMPIQWEAVLDLTCELPKRVKTKYYLNLQSWDGSVNYSDIQTGATFVAEHFQNGPVLIHCAHGVGRSTTFMRAGMVEAGVCTDINEAFKVIKARRHVAKSSKPNQKILERWQRKRNRKSTDSNPQN